jgi:hypothetical protein
VLGELLPSLLEKSALRPRAPVTTRADRPAHKPLNARRVAIDIAIGTRTEKLSFRKSKNGRISLLSRPRPEKEKPYINGRHLKQQ